MSKSVMAVLEVAAGSRPDGTPIYKGFAELFLDQVDGFVLHRLGGYSDDSPHSPSDIGCSDRARMTYDRDAEIITSGVFKLESGDEAVEDRKKALPSGVSAELAAVLDLLRELGPRSRIVFWYGI